MSGDTLAVITGCAALAVFIFAELRIRRIRMDGIDKILSKYTKGDDEQ